MSAPKRPRGRPRTSPTGEARTQRMEALGTAAEVAHLAAAAEAQGLTSAEYVRRAVAYCAALRVPLRHVTVGPLPAGVVVE